MVVVGGSEQHQIGICMFRRLDRRCAAKACSRNDDPLVGVDQ